MVKSKSLTLNNRDRDLLSCVFLFRVARTSQISTLLFANAQTARNRLLDLKNAGYLHAIAQCSRGIRRENLWTITGKSLPVVKDWLAHYRREINCQQYRIDPSMYPHELRIFDAFVTLVKRGIVDFSSILTGDFLITRMAEVPLSTYRTAVKLKPDARFKRDDRWYWLEIDRGTERLAHINRKLERYMSYFEQSHEHHTIFFLMDNGMQLTPAQYQARIDEIRWMAAAKLGSMAGFVSWYTFDYVSDFHDILDAVMDNDPVKAGGKRLAQMAVENSFITGHQLRYFDKEYVPRAMPPALWFAVRTEAFPQGLFYVVENLIGGESGALSRLQYFSSQQIEFVRSGGGNRPRLLLIVDNSGDMTLIDHRYPELKKDCWYITRNDLFGGRYQITSYSSGEKGDLWC